MECSLCKTTVNDVVKCGECSKDFGYCCANISEQGYRKLGPERRANWRCSACKRKVSPASPVPQASEAPLAPLAPQAPQASQTSMACGDGVTLEAIMAEIKGLKVSLCSLPGLVQDVKEIKTELTNVKSSCESNSAKLDEYKIRLAEVEKQLPDLTRLQAKLDTVEGELSDLKQQFASKEQWSRLNNVEIKGVPLKKNENLFTIVENISKAVNYAFPKTCINYISRVPIQNSKEKLIIVSFINRYVKEDFVASARAKKSLKATEIGFDDSQQKVYVNDHLTPEAKKLLTKTKLTLKQKGYLYVWVKFGKIHVRKDDTTQAFVIHRESDLNKLF